MKSVVQILDRLFEKRVIVNCERDPYLNRWYVLRTQRLGIFIHQFVRSDEDRALHDHPWSFLVIPLWGGYIEHSDTTLEDADFLDLLKLTSAQAEEAFESRRVPRSRRVWPIISTRYRSTKYRHRVELIKGRHSWSLFFRFTKVREWGFWPKDGFIQWNKWWQDKCE